MMSRCLRILMLALVMPAVLAVSAPGAEGAKPPGPRIAVVDVDRLEAGFQTLKAKQQELEKMRARDAEILQELSQYGFLSDDLFKEVVAIVQLPKPWPKDKAARAAQLKKISEDKEKEFLALRANTKRTPEQEDRFKELQEMSRARQQDMRQLEQSFLQELLNRQRELQQQLLQRVQQTIQTVAKAKKYDYVFDKSVVFLGGDDITEDVLKALNAPTPAGGTQPKPGEQGDKGGK